MSLTSMTIDYENPWLYKDTNFTSDDINDFFGFVYRITNNKMLKRTYSVDLNCSL